MNTNFDITIHNRTKKLIIAANVIDSHHATLLANGIDQIAYLRVEERKYHNQLARIHCTIIAPGIDGDDLEEEISKIDHAIIQQYESTRF